MNFFIVPLLIALQSACASAFGGRVAAAFFHEDDGMYGSIVFRQQERSGPVEISISLHNIKVERGQQVDWRVHDGPVHYEVQARGIRCGAAGVGGVMHAGRLPVGRLGLRHGMINGSDYARVVYDWKVSLFEGSHRSIVNKSLVVGLGDADDSRDLQCQTVELTRWHGLKVGAVPCEKMVYSDCLVGTAREGVCVRRVCGGWRRFWGTVGERTTFCRQVVERFPKVSEGAGGGREGVVPCKHGLHTLLQPVEQEVV